MVSSKLGIGANQGWIAGGLGLLDTIRRTKVSAIRGIQDHRNANRVGRAIAAIEKRKDQMRGGVFRTRYGVPSSTMRRLVIALLACNRVWFRGENRGKGANVPDYADCCSLTSPLCLISKEGVLRGGMLVCRGKSSAICEISLLSQCGQIRAKRERDSKSAGHVWRC